MHHAIGEAASGWSDHLRTRCNLDRSPNRQGTSLAGSDGLEAITLAPSSPHQLTTLYWLGPRPRMRSPGSRCRVAGYPHSCDGFANDLA
jgi:hypothetical protein